MQQTEDKMTLFERNLNALQDTNLRTMLLDQTCKTEQIDLLPAQNGKITMRLNGYFMYSRYNPTEDASRFIASQVNDSMTYCLFSFGLGYHVRELMKQQPGKQIIVIETSISVLKEAILHTDVSDIFSNKDVQILCSIDEVSRINWDSLGKTKWIIPNNWLKALPQIHPLKSFLEDLKIKDMSSQRFGEIMGDNFLSNIEHKNVDIGKTFGEFFDQKAVLVAAGPSLDETIIHLEKLKNNYYILAVGSALRSLIKNGIKPDSVIITDPQETVSRQFEGLGYEGILFSLSTACKKSFSNHKGLKTVILQSGFPPAEKKAVETGFSLLMDTGGSVATTGFELLVKMGFKEIILFGQDLAFDEDKTHSNFSASNKKIINHKSLLKVSSNDGSMVYSTSVLSVYRRWFERKISSLHNVKVWNVAKKGAAIKGAQYLPVENIPLLGHSFDYENNLKKILWDL